MVPIFLSLRSRRFPQHHRRLIVAYDLDEGESHASLNELAKELLTDSSPFDAAKHVRNITQIGQSSGWDMLTGMLAGLLPVIHRA